MSLTMAEYAKAVPTPTATGTCKNRSRSGAVMVPAPTPVTAITKAIKNPIAYSILVFLFVTQPARGYRIQFFVRTSGRSGDRWDRAAGLYRARIRCWSNPSRTRAGVGCGVLQRTATRRAWTNPQED